MSKTSMRFSIILIFLWEAETERKILGDAVVRTSDYLSVDTCSLIVGVQCRAHI